MSLVRVFSGTSEIVENTGEECTPRFYLILIVHDAEKDTKLTETEFKIARGMASHTVATDENAHLTLEFDDLTDLKAAKLKVKWDKFEALHWEVSSERNEVKANVYRAHVFISYHWLVEVEVMDAMPEALRSERDPISLAQAPIHFAWPPSGKFTRPTTGDAGEAFEFRTMDVGMEYTIKVPVEGAIPEATTVQFDIPEQAEVEHSLEDGVVKLKVNTPGVRVAVRFKLSFEKVFIVGEGNGFAYAIPLAQKYHGPGGKYDDLRSESNDCPYPNKKAKTTRKWIIASQYDVNQPTSGVDNLFVHRDDEGPGGQFNALLKSHWDRVKDTFGADFEAILFNNPHPGYGEHMVEVMGTKVDEELRGKYISVHTFGSTRLVALKAPNSEETSGELQTFRDLSPSPGDADKQRGYVQTTLGIVQDGSNKVLDFADVPPTEHTIRGVFSPTVDYEHNALNFKAAETHYNPVAATNGLKYLLLARYRQYGKSLLKGGGFLCINGSTAIKDDLKALNLDSSVKSKGKWIDHKHYFVRYETNYTSEEIHPSWLAHTEFDPGEPELDNARVYIETK